MWVWQDTHLHISNLVMFLNIMHIFCVGFITCVNFMCITYIIDIYLLRKMLLHSSAFRRKFVGHCDAEFAQRRFYTQPPVDRKTATWQNRHTEEGAFAQQFQHGNFTPPRSQLSANETSAQRSGLHTEIFRDTVFSTEKPLHKDSCTHKRANTERSLHLKIVAGTLSHMHTNFYTETL